MEGPNQSTDSKNGPQLVGNVNITPISINGITSNALLDTGSMVSIVSQSFYDKNLIDVELRPLDEILYIECASGNLIPYSGYIQVELETLGVPKAEKQDALFLVSPDTNFSTNTPLIIGTNILNEVKRGCKEAFGDRYLQVAKLTTPWYTSFRTLVIQERHLKQNKNRLGIIKSAVSCKISIRPNQTVDVKGFIDKKLSHQPTAAILQVSEDTPLPDYLDITPGVIHYNFDEANEVTVTLSNLSANTVTISPKAILCEIQPVMITEESIMKMEEDELDKKRAQIVKELTIDAQKLLSEEERKKVELLLMQHKDIMSTGDLDIGLCNKIKHRIDMIDPTPFKQKHRRIPPHMIEEVRTHLEQLHATGIIRPSKSPYASPVVLVRKKSGKLRLCVDYRKLNERSVKDSYALPRIEEVLDSLHATQYFSTLDMKSGYHQVEIEEEHKERTGFTVGALGFWDYQRLPFGLTNSPATYQRLMEECLGSLNMSICIIYLDDIIIFSKTFEEHLERLDKVLTRLKSCNLKLAPEKCCFFTDKVKFLGHVVSRNGIETDPEKIDKIKDWPTPKTPSDLHSFLTFAGYYRRFIKDYAKITRPLFDLIPNPTAKKGSKENKIPLKWTKEEEEIFEDLKTRLSSPPILAYPDFTKQFELHTDASNHGLGAVLYQIEGKVKRVIAYASRSLSKAEKNYSTYKLEFLALKWAITEKFSDYLTGPSFKVYTDNNPLTYILKSPKLDATGQRCVAALGQYNFEIKYRPGKSNIDADILSRYPFREEELDEDSIKAICNATTASVPYIESLPAMAVNIVDIGEQGTQMAQVELREIRKQQMQDSVIGKWRVATIDRKIIDKTFNKQDMVMKKNFKHFKIKRGLLFREIIENNATIEQLVIPECFKQDILQGLHTDIGHTGIERTTRLIRERFFWPCMTVEIEDYIKKCDRCLRRKTATNTRAPLVNIHTNYPLELVCFDFLTLESSKGGYSNILVITDHFTKFAMAIPTKNQTAKTTAETFYNNFIVHYGIPTRLHSDQGANFESTLIKELCLLTNMKKSHTTVYHPQGNAGPERFNRTLISMLGTLENSQKSDWTKYIHSLVFAYNSIPHETTRVSPYELMFGRKPRLPIDAMFSEAREDAQLNKNTEEYIEDLRNKIKKTREIAETFMAKAKKKQKYYYDQKLKGNSLDIGDQVLVKILAREGKHKIADKFEEELYTVIEKPRGLPVYVVKGNETDRIRKLHRNHLFPVNYRVEKDDKGEEEEKLSDDNQKDEDVIENKEEHSDVTEDMESSDEEEIVIVQRTDAHGDACDIDSTQSEEPTEQIEIKPDDNIDADQGSTTPTILSNSEVGIDLNSPEEETSIQTGTVEESFTVDRPVIEEKDIEDVQLNCETFEEDVIETRQEIAETNDPVMEENNTAIDVSLNREPVREPEQTERILQTEAPRRSERERKIPERYGPYISHGVQTTNKKSRLKALETLVTGGILDDMDIEIARSIINAIMK